MSLAGDVLVPARTGVGFARSLRDFTGRTALVTDAGPVGYEHLADRVEAWGDRLGGSRRLVLLRLGPDPELVAAYLAALAGGHPVVAVPAEGGALAGAVASRFDPDVVVAAEGGEVHLQERRTTSRHRLHPDLALLLSTSGSTGSPKLVRLSADAVDANARAIATAIGIAPDDVALTTLPLHYCYGLSVLHSHLATGARVVLTGRSLVDQGLWEQARRHRVTSLALVPHGFDLLDRLGSPGALLPSLRRVTQAGGRLAPDRVRRYAALGEREGWELVVMYGQTEATARIAVLPPSEAARHPSTIGHPVPGGRLWLEPADPAEPAAPAEGAAPATGELVYAGPNVMLGYASAPADLAAGREVEALHTGDLARRTPDGRFEVVGRLARFAKVLGLRLDLDRVEQVLGERGTTARCAQAEGRDVLVVATTGRTRTPSVTRAVRELTGLPAHAVDVVGVPELPVLPSGKPDYRAVARLGGLPLGQAGPDALASALARSGDPVRDRESALVSLYARVLGRPRTAPTDSFVGLGGDSLSYVEVSVWLDRALPRVPADWPGRAIADLAREAPPAGDRPSPRWARLETSVVLRAVAIVLVVGTHSNLFGLMGGAHVLLALAGYHYARFVLADPDRWTRFRRGLGTTVRVVVPSVAWTLTVVLLTDQYAWANVVLLNGVLGDPAWGDHWHLWFVEAVVYLLAAATLLTALPAVHRWERRHPFGLPLLVAVACLVPRYGLSGLEEGPGLRFYWYGVAWLFAAGWAAARADTTARRLAVSALAVVATPGFFGDPAREAAVVAGLLVLVWVSRVPWPRRLVTPTAVVAASSLAIYLVHWQVYPHLEHRVPVLGLLLSLLAGVLVHRACTGVRRLPVSRKEPL